MLIVSLDVQSYGAQTTIRIGSLNPTLRPGLRQHLLAAARKADAYFKALRAGMSVLAHGGLIY
jgi:hypothetical protein